MPRPKSDEPICCRAGTEDESRDLAYACLKSVDRGTLLLEHYATSIKGDVFAMREEFKTELGRLMATDIQGDIRAMRQELRGELGRIVASTEQVLTAVTKVSWPIPRTGQQVVRSDSDGTPELDLDIDLLSKPAYSEVEGADEQCQEGSTESTSNCFEPDPIWAAPEVNFSAADSGERSGENARASESHSQDYEEPSDVPRCIPLTAPVGLKPVVFDKIGEERADQGLTLLEAQQGLIPSTQPELVRKTSVVVVPTEKEEKAMLQHILAYTESLEDKARAVKEAQKDKLRYLRHRWKNMTTRELSTFVDVVMGFVITINAIIMGVSMDYDSTHNAWIVVDFIFSLLFVAEIVIKINLHGLAGHFCGPTYVSSAFDASLLAIDLANVILLLSGTDAQHAEGMPSASLLRLVRLLKLLRLLRILQLNVFSDVVTMVQGIIGGMGTLLWSMVLYVIMIYMVGLLCRALMGTRQLDNVYEMFSTVPRSMFTTFRCSFGDCTTSSGQPIFEFVHDGYGSFASVLYCIFVFSVTIGIFNVVSAIFVERTLEAASDMHKAQKDQRLQDETLWNTRITTLIRHMVEASEESPFQGKLSEAVDTVHSIDMHTSLFDALVKRPEVKQALDDLDINPDDHRYLSELLDPDNGGSITVVDFVNGLRRLRGDPRRSDIVHVNMMLRSMQLAVCETQVSVFEIESQIHKLRDALLPAGQAVAPTSLESEP